MNGAERFPTVVLLDGWPPGILTRTMTSKLLAVGVEVLLLTGAGAAAVSTGVVTNGADTPEESGPRDVDAQATLDNGTVTVTVTADGDAIENVTVSADDEDVGTTGANGTVTFETNETEELEIGLEKGDFEGELSYAVQNGSLVLVEEAYEYPEVEADQDDEDDEEDADDEEDDADEDDEETEDDDAETEDDEETEDGGEADDSDDDAETDGDS